MPLLLEQNAVFVHELAQLRELMAPKAMVACGRHRVEQNLG
jgi:hypothetical protein